MTDFNNKYNKNLPDNEKKKLQKQFHESDLNYLSSFAFEANLIKTEDLEELNRSIDKRVSGSVSGLNLNVIVALALGIFIGCSVFLVWKEKSKTFAAHQEDINFSAPIIPNNQSLSPNLQSEQKPENSPDHLNEHFSISESGEQLNLLTPMENMDIKDINSIEVKEKNEAAPEELLNYIPNSSVIFIHDLKVANYKNYYFKNFDNIDIRNNGLPAQFSDKEEVNNLSKRLQDKDYFAHEIINDAMEAFNKKQFYSCIELLDLLNAYNKDDVNTQFYLGMCYYYTGNFNKAISYFNNALNNNVNIFLQEAEFYSALCFKKSGKITEAEVQFKKIISKKLFYASRAEEEIK